MEMLLNIDQALAKFIASLSNLIWVLALAIALDFYLRLEGLSEELVTVNTIGSIVWAIVWLVIALKAFDLVDKWLDKKKF